MELEISPHSSYEIMQWYAKGINIQYEDLVYQYMIFIA